MVLFYEAVLILDHWDVAGFDWKGRKWVGEVVAGVGGEPLGAARGDLGGNLEQGDRWERIATLKREVTSKNWLAGGC
jgi:hypothetical protein